MKRRLKFTLVGFLLFLTIVSVILGSGIVHVSKLSLFINPPAATTATTASVFVDPAKFIKDYPLQPVGSKFTVNVNVSAATDLFAWQINMTWNRSILNVVRATAGEFLLRTSSASKTAAYQLGFVINKTDNAKGYTDMGESILGGVPGISGNGRLVSIEFLVVGYGQTNLNISLTGNLPTLMLDSAGQVIPFAKIDGFFSNRLYGDTDGDRDVDFSDFSVLAGAYGSISGQPAYKIQSDFDRDGDVDFSDFSKLAGNYGKHV